MNPVYGDKPCNFNFAILAEAVASIHCSKIRASSGKSEPHMEPSRRNYRNEFVAVLIIAIISVAAAGYLFESYQSQNSDVSQQRQEINRLQAQVHALNVTASSGELAQMKSISSEMDIIQAQLSQSNSSQVQQQLSFVESEVSDLEATLNACSGTQPAPQRTTGPNDTVFVPILLMNPGETALPLA